MTISKTKPAEKKVNIKSSGVIKLRLKDYNETKKTHTINSDKVEYCYLKNADPTLTVKYTFNGDNIGNHFGTLLPGEKTNVFGVTNGTKIDYIRLGGSGTGKLEVHLWG